MVINGHLHDRTNQMAGSIDMLLQTVALELGAALVAGYWPARWVARQPVIEGLRKE